MVRMFSLAVVFPSPIAAIASLAWDENRASGIQKTMEKGKLGHPSNTGGHILGTFNAHDWN